LQKHLIENSSETLRYEKRCVDMQYLKFWGCAVNV